eukprot:5204223-Pyramimonas_sp.AAC.1
MKGAPRLRLTKRNRRAAGPSWTVATPLATEPDPECKRTYTPGSASAQRQSWGTERAAKVK